MIFGKSSHLLTHKIVYSPASLADMFEIRDHITHKLHNSAAAAKLLIAIKTRIEALKTSPLIGSPITADLTPETTYRFLLCGNYYNFYRTEEDCIKIVRIIYQRRDYIQILFGKNTTDKE